jgi:hypothetical protein
VDLNGLRVHLLSFVSHDTQAVMASGNSQGCVPLRDDIVKERVSASAAAADVVIALAHWGYCDYPVPSPDQARMVESMFTAGATAVVGHHSHVVQGVSRRAGRLVAYSLGNFAFAEYSHRERRVRLSRDNLSGMILSIIVDRDGVVGCDVHHTRLEDGNISLDCGPARSAEFARRCRLVLPGRLEANWKRAVRARLARRLFYWANPARWSGIGRQQLAGGGIMLKEMARRRK